MAELAPLLAHGILSTYTHFEATEVFATLDGQKQAINVFTILVAEDRQGQQSQQAKYLTDRIQFKSLPGWTFGVQRYTRPISELPPAIDETAIHEANLGIATRDRRDGQNRRVARVWQVLADRQRSANPPSICPARLHNLGTVESATEE
ncbi:MAG: hypothetical protein ABSG18_22525 [Steroidobacteraceae bacterium]